MPLNNHFLRGGLCPEILQHGCDSSRALILALHMMGIDAMRQAKGM